MTPVIPYSISNVSLIPGTVFTRKAGSSTRFSLSKKISVKTPCILLPRSASFPLLLRSRSRVCSASATETDVAVEEPETPVAGEAEEGSSAEPEAPALAKAQSKRARPKKSEFPPVKNEDLVAGAWFDGKVVSVQPFGAFVDFGAFTDGLVHVSQLSDGFVKEVGSVVSVGQEVKVRLIETVAENGRISLSLLSGEDSGKEQSSQRRESSGGPGRKGDSKPPRRGDPKKVSKFSKGQDLEGTVKNMNRAGAFVSLPEGEEGFLPVAEELDDGFGTMMGETTLEVGQEVSVRVLKIARGQVTLTMKKEEDIPKTNVQVSQGVMHTASNPFLLAFRKNKDIAAFLDEREKKVETETVAPEESVDEKVETEASSLVEAPKESEIEVASEPVLEEPVAEKVEAEASSFEEAPKETENEILSEAVPEEPVTEKVEPEASTLEEAPKESENEVVSEAVVEEPVEEKVEAESSTPEEAPKASENEVVSEAVPDATDEKVETQAEVSSEALSTDEVSEEQPEEATAKDEPLVETPAEETQVPSSATTETPSQRPKASISPALVKQLREETGAGMMDCKNALSESGGDMAKAQEYLRKKGLAGAEKKASRATAEGRVGSYIHDSRIGVLVEVNCETDFVSRGDIFRELVDDVAMQVAACPQVLHISTEDVPQETVTKEREIEMQKEDLASKPEQMRERIVDGRIKKRLDELTLLEQPYIKNDKVVVKDFVKQTIATVGENIQVRRFVRFNLGEGLEKKSQDFAAEVAAQTSTKPAAPKPQGTAETEPTVEKAPPAVAVSAALVKQLRDESGAGMMDCKKALSESGGDLEKAQEYLRKKGLASADKKSSRIAAEGRIGSYIHDSRIGVLIEVNCETDFVSRGDRFKELVDDLAMQVAACPQVSFVSLEEIGAEVAQREKAAEMQREDLQSKPESIRERIVEGRVAKRLGELALLEQPFIKDDSLLVKDLVRQTIAALGENIRVRRFVRFTLGEKLDGQESSL